MFRIARNIGKYCSQSKGYIEDASDEFAFESFTKILPQQSVTKDQFKDTASIFQGTSKLGSIGSYKILDSAEIRKLIYARFASEIAFKPKNVVDTKSHETKEYVGDAVAAYNIADEFNDLRTQGYDFAGARKAIENQNVRSLSDRMKGLVVAGYISNYGGESGLKEEVEELMDKKALVIAEFMQRLSGEIEVNSSELLG